VSKLIDGSYLCDGHLVKMYRAVSAAMETVKDVAVPMRINKGQRSAAFGPNRRTRPGIIYFAQIGDLIKIGYTTNLRQRMIQLGVDKVLASMPGTMRDEEALHHRFGSDWVDREMFRPGPDLMAFIDSLKAA